MYWSNLVAVVIVPIVKQKRLLFDCRLAKLHLLTELIGVEVQKREFEFISHYATANHTERLRIGGIF